VESPPLRLWEYFFWLREPEGSLMGALHGYWDDSDDNTAAISVAGYVGVPDAWRVFDQAWATALGELPYLHMADLEQGKRPFEGYGKYHPEAAARTAKLLKNCAEAIGAAKLRGVGAVVPQSAVQKLNAERALTLSPKAVAIFAAAITIKLAFDGTDVSIVLDRSNGAHEALGSAERYFENFCFWLSFA
jgi:hypothetical protein